MKAVRRCSTILAVLGPAAARGALLGALLALGFAACSDDNGVDARPDSGLDAVIDVAGDTGEPDTGADGPALDSSADTAADEGTPDTAPPDLPPASPYEGQLLITEVMVNPAAVADTAGEWIEVHNASGSAIDLQGWTLADEGSDSHVIGSTVTVAPGAYAVLARNATTAENGGVSAAYEYGNDVELGNNGDEIVLLDDQQKLVDRIVYTSSWKDPPGASRQLKPGETDNGDLGNWCESTVPWATDTDLGTPGAANVCGGGDGGVDGDLIDQGTDLDSGDAGADGDLSSQDQGTDLDSGVTTDLAHDQGADLDSGPGIDVS